MRNDRDAPRGQPGESAPGAGNHRRGRLAAAGAKAVGGVSIPSIAAPVARQMACQLRPSHVPEIAFAPVGIDRRHDPEAVAEQGGEERGAARPE